SARFAFLRKFTERQRDALLLALAPHRELHIRTRSHCTDLIGEITGILNRSAIDGSDDIAREDASFGGGAICLRLGDERAFGSFYSEALGGVGRDPLGLPAGPAPADPALRRAPLRLGRREHGEAPSREDWG